MYFKFEDFIHFLMGATMIPILIIIGILTLIGLALIIRHLFEPHRLIFPWVLTASVADILLIACSFAVPVKTGYINIFDILATILTVGILIYGLLLTVTDIDDEDFWWSRY